MSSGYDDSKDDELDVETAIAYKFMNNDQMTLPIALLLARTVDGKVIK